MSDILLQAKTDLLTPTGLDESQLNQIFSDLLHQNDIEMAELYFQNHRAENWFLDESIVKHSDFFADKGVGVRAITQDKTGFAYTNDLSLQAIKTVAKAAQQISPKSSNQSSKVAFESMSRSSLYSSENPLNSLLPDQKVTLLKEIDEYTRKQDPRVQRVTVNLSGVYDTVLIYDSEGTVAADIRPLIHLSIQVILVDKGRTEEGHYGGGARRLYDYFTTKDLWKRYAKEAIRLAQVNLESIPAPAGLMPVVLGSGWNAVLLHEAVGHGLEGDFNRKGTSAYSGRIGEKVASSLCTIVDDGTIADRRGSLSMDDEGVPSQKNVLIQEGVLKKYMQDKMNARLMGVEPTGNGRRQSYAYMPMPRMTNTYMLPGQDDPKDIIASVSKGIYVASMGGGQVDITSGQFVFSASEAYLIEKGKITTPIKGATLIGNGPDVMTQVSMVGHDLELDAGFGVCGKSGQNLPVGVGQPTLKIEAITVGGTTT